MANEIEVKLTLEEKQAVAALTKLAKSSKKFEKDATKSFKKATTAFDVFKGVLTAGIVQSAFSSLARGAVVAFTTIVDKSKELEAISAQFVTLTGSVEKAEGVIKELQEFTATTPFQFPGIARAAAQLISFGFSVEEIVPKLTVLGDVASGSGSSLGELALIFGQVRAAGKLTGERLLQFQERAVPIGPALAKTLGVAESAVKDLVSKGVVSFDIFEKAFSSLNDEGSLFFGATIRASKTLGGVLSTLSDNFDLVTTDIGQAFLPVLKELAIETIKFIQNNRELVQELSSGLAVAFQKAAEFAGVALRAMIRFFEFVNNNSETLIDTFRRMAPTIAAVSDALGLINPAKVEAVTVSIEDLDAKIANLKAQLETEQSLGINVGDTEARVAALNEELKLVEQQRATMAANEASRDQEAAARDEAAKQRAQDKKNAEIEASREKIDVIAALEEEDKLRKEEELLAENVAKEEATEEDFQKLVENRERQQQIESQFKGEELASFKKGLGEKKKARDKADKDERNGITSLFNFEKNTQAGRAQNFKSTLSTISQLQGSSNKALGAAGKAAAISVATIDGIAAVQKALASVPPPFNFVLAALVGAVALQNVNKIRSSPAFQEGGIVPGNQFSGDNVNARVNSGEAILNRQQQTNLFNAIDQNALGGGGVTVNIAGNVLGNEEFTQDLVEQIRDVQEFRNAEGFA